ncbi:MAG: glutamine amidotransferase, partial [Geminicoccaceae bacterium]
MTRKVLIVVHQEHSTPGKVGAFLEKRGYALDRRCPNLGDPLPENLDDYAATVVFGGPMSANDDY